MVFVIQNEEKSGWVNNDMGVNPDDLTHTTLSAAVRMAQKLNRVWDDAHLRVVEMGAAGTYKVRHYCRPGPYHWTRQTA